MVTCTVCLIAKNEGPYLLEWIAYYRNIGFDKVVVYENNSSDSSASLLKALARSGQIIHRPWKLGAKESPQITAYVDAIGKADTDWIFFVDCDEFLVLHNTTLKNMLAPIHARSNVTAIGINWRIFGSSHRSKWEPGLVIERFTRAAAADFPMNDHLKSFLRIGTIGPHIDMHMSDTNGQIVFADGEELTLLSRGRSNKIRLDCAQINHYYTKTYEEYLVKAKRGQAGTGENSDLKYWYNDDSFKLHDVNDVEDLSALNYLDDTQLEIKRLRNFL
ncbi:glycosyltransferase family 2 protein [Asticcacaulis sp. DW145]|uniref:glycosyltransferase family 2 protein n=1 Tax=Asticcacaulis sp. DW145 TaxID=3095608 RepID=UPI00308DF41A|nr:glycosyltransferase family 2 protein [Asticcacaulis sp. DW145]